MSSPTCACFLHMAWFPYKLHPFRVGLVTNFFLDFTVKQKEKMNVIGNIQTIATGERGRGGERLGEWEMRRGGDGKNLHIDPLPSSFFLVPSSLFFR